MKTGILKKSLSSCLSKEKQVIFAFLYGSYAKGTALKDSDLDIAVYFRRKPTANEVDRIWDELQRISGKDVELLVLNNAKESIAWQAIRGIPLLINNWALYIGFMLRVSFEAMDFQRDVEEIWMRKKRLGYA